MTPDAFLALFDRFAEGPGAVKKVRKLVLYLAVRGKIVQQAHEETAPAMLSRLHKDWTPDRLIPDDSQIYCVPTSWAWARFQDVAIIASDLVNPKDHQDAIHLAPDNIEKGNGVLLPCKTVREDGVISPNHRFHAGQVIYSKIRPSLAKVTLARFDGLCSADMYPLDSLIDVHYLLFFILSDVFLDQAVKTDTRVAMPKINQAELNAIAVPVPPLAEQKRIVAKVDELMALCDRLEAQQQEQETRQTALARASLARFVDAPTPANLDFLFHRAFTVSPVELRKAILALAMQGKLLSQDSTDEPADVWLNRFSAVRRSKSLKSYGKIQASEIPCEIPLSWAWTRLGNIVLTSDSGWSPQCESEARSGNDWGVLKVSAVSWGVFRSDENKALPSGVEARPDCEVLPGDFLLSRANTEDLVARSVVVESTPPRLMMSDKIVRFTFPTDVEKRFINLANLSDAARDYYARNASGTSSSMKNIGREVMCNLPLPFPPLPEQRRIVAKVDQLMALVDQLETHLAESRTTATRLMDAIVTELTGRTATARMAAASATTTGAAAPVAPGTQWRCDKKKPQKSPWIQQNCT